MKHDSILGDFYVTRYGTFFMDGTSVGNDKLTFF